MVVVYRMQRQRGRKISNRVKNFKVDSGSSRKRVKQTTSSTEPLWAGRIKGGISTPTESSKKMAYTGDGPQKLCLQTQAQEAVSQRSTTVSSLVTSSEDETALLPVLPANEKQPLFARSTYSATAKATGGTYGSSRVGKQEEKVSKERNEQIAREKMREMLDCFKATHTCGRSVLSKKPETAVAERIKPSILCPWRSGTGNRMLARAVCAAGLGAGLHLAVQLDWIRLHVHTPAGCKWPIILPHVMVLWTAALFRFPSDKRLCWPLRAAFFLSGCFLLAPELSRHDVAVHFSSYHRTLLTEIGLALGTLTLWACAVASVLDARTAALHCYREWVRHVEEKLMVADSMEKAAVFGKSESDRALGSSAMERDLFVKKLVGEMDLGRSSSAGRRSAKPLLHAVVKNLARRAGVGGSGPAAEAQQLMSGRTTAALEQGGKPEPVSRTYCGELPPPGRKNKCGLVEAAEEQVEEVAAADEDDELMDFAEHQRRHREDLSGNCDDYLVDWQLLQARAEYEAWKRATVVLSFVAFVGMLCVVRCFVFAYEKAAGWVMKDVARIHLPGYEAPDLEELFTAVFWLYSVGGLLPLALLDTHT